MKKISTDQLNAILQVVYQTNISAQQFDAIKEMISKLEDVEEKKDKK